MARPNPAPMVRNVPGEKPTKNQLSEGRAAARANHGPTHDQIQLRAFQIFEARGRMHGHDVQDWMQAERELRRIE